MEPGVSVVGGPARRPPATSARERSRARKRTAGRKSRTEPQGEPRSDERTSDAPQEEGDGGWSLTNTGQRVTRSRQRVGNMSPAAQMVVGALAVVGVVAGIVFGLAWANLNGQKSDRQAVEHQARTFLDDFFNFRPSNVDAVFADL